MQHGDARAWLIDTLKGLTLNYTIPTFFTLRKKPYENIVGKGENACNHHLDFRSR